MKVGDGDKNMKSTRPPSVTIIFMTNFYKARAIDPSISDTGWGRTNFMFLGLFLYKSGMVNSKSFVGKILLRIKQKFELTYAL